MSAVHELPDGRRYIAGEWRHGCGAPITSIFPADRQINRVFGGASREDAYEQFSIATPFGGVKDSGLGRETAHGGLKAWQAQKSLYVDLSGQPQPWVAATVKAVR